MLQQHLLKVCAVLKRNQTVFKHLEGSPWSFLDASLDIAKTMISCRTSFKNQVLIYMLQQHVLRAFWMLLTTYPSCLEASLSRREHVEGGLKRLEHIIKRAKTTILYCTSVQNQIYICMLQQLLLKASWMHLKTCLTRLEAHLSCLEPPWRRREASWMRRGPCKSSINISRNTMNNINNTNNHVDNTQQRPQSHNSLSTKRVDHIRLRFAKPQPSRRASANSIKNNRFWFHAYSAAIVFIDR